jgi:galactokinase
VHAILDAWRAASGRADGSLAEAIERAGAAEVREVVERSPIDGFGTAVVLDRFDQFVEESVGIIPAAADALARRELERFGVLVDRSQDLAERLLGNQVPETIGLARVARDLGADAASAFGAGFGGSVWALVAQSEVEVFAARWEAAYRAAFPAASPSVLVTRPGPSAVRLEPSRR